MDEGDELYFGARRAYERIAQREAADEGVAWRSVLMSHGHRAPRSYVLLHGLTASPEQFIQFGDALHARGGNIFIPRLPRHGRSRLSKALAGLTADELATSARESIGIARGLGERVTVAGFSAGGLLSAWIAQHLAVDRAVCIAPFLGVGWLPTAVAPYVSRMALRLPNRFLWWNPFRRERHGPPHGYPRFATHAIGRTWQLALEVLEAARLRPPATKSIAIVSNDSETTVDNRAIERLVTLWRAHPGVTVEVHRLRGLPRSHDIIEPMRRRPLAAVVYPALLGIVEGEASAGAWMKAQP